MHSRRSCGKRTRFVLAARWELYFGTTPDVSGLAATLSRIKALGADVVLVGQGPSFDFDNPNDFIFRTGRMEARSHAVNALNVKLSHLGVAAFVDPMPVFCTSDRCALKKDQMHLFFDGGHFSKAGSQYFARTLMPVVDRVLVQAAKPVGASGAVAKPAQ